MKFLTLPTETNPPRILEMGKDFDTIRYQTIIDVDGSDVDHSYLEKDEEIVCYLGDCWQQRSLLQLYGFCEFDLRTSTTFYKKGTQQTRFSLSPLATLVANYKVKENTKSSNEGSIFTPANSVAYPELYQQALEIINQEK